MNASMCSVISGMKSRVSMRSSSADLDGIVLSHCKSLTDCTVFVLYCLAYSLKKAEYRTSVPVGFVLFHLAKVDLIFSFGLCFFMA